MQKYLKDPCSRGHEFNGLGRGLRAMGSEKKEQRLLAWTCFSVTCTSFCFPLFKFLNNKTTQIILLTCPVCMELSLLWDI